MHKKQSPVFTKKRVALLVSLLTVVCLIAAIGTTLAWTDFSQSVVNRFRGTTDPQATLHDEYDGENKDIFVENSGNQDIYVRIRLDEYMEIGGKSFVEKVGGVDVTAKTKDLWQPHLWPQTAGTDITECNCVDAGNSAHKFHSYYAWTVSGAARDYNPGTPGLPYTKLDPITGKVDTTGSETTQAAAKPITMTEYLRLKALSEDPAVIDHGLSARMSAEEIAAWTAATTTGCWILDADGWAYWSVALKPDTATNLLLDEVSSTGKDIPDDWYYAIDVKMQAVTSNDLTEWNVTSGTDAEKLLQSWAD